MPPAGCAWGPDSLQQSYPMLTCHASSQHTVRCRGLKWHLVFPQAAGLSQRETNDLLDSYVREQVEEKGASESHM